MAVYKCKMCGGDLNIEADLNVIECEYCGTTQTVPGADNEKKVNLFNRANRLRFNGEFDKAAGIYESIIAEFPEEAEAYWGLCLCNYGIEYVDDPATAKKVPTCHRASFEKLSADENFNMAMEYSDVVARKVYRDEAREIDRIMDNILSISKNEKPYDVFICYKETDEKGERTIDSVLAQDIYDALTSNGFKVFFARITLEDKLGQMYEPYIFAALNSAKVLLSVGTKYEHFHAVWVKNEWSRFLKLMAADKSKVLIPCYKDMDAYDMPEEFKAFQAQDMGKIGFMQDLTRGIKKVIKSDEPEAETGAASNNTTVAPLLKRAFIFLEDGNWQSADEYCEKVLDLDPECAKAYLGKLMAELKVRKPADLINCSLPFDNRANYQKVIRFADSALKEKLEQCIKAINDRNELARLEGIYAQACQKMDQAKAEIDFKAAANIFSKISHFRDSAEMVKKCCEKAEEAKIIAQKDAVYNNACEALNRNANRAEKYVDYEKMLADFRSLGDWRDSPRKAEECLKRMKKIEAENERAKALKVQQEKKNATIKKALIIGASALVVLIIVAAFIVSVSKSVKYKEAVELAEGGKYEEAVVLFEELGNYKDSKGQLELLKQKQKYNEAVAALEKGDKAKAAMIFGEASGYKNARERSLALWNETAVRKTVSAGNGHTVALKSDGRVVAAGYNLFGQCKVEGWTDIVAVSANRWHTVGLKSDGTVVAVGSYEYGVEGWTDIVAVSAGENHNVGLKSDGTVVAAGKNGNGQCGVGDWTDIVAVSAGDSHTVGLKSDGTVVAVGSNGYGQCDVGGWTDIVAVSAGNLHTVGLKSDGTVVAVGRNVYGQCDVGGWKDMVAVSAGLGYTVGLKSNGRVVAIGNNYEGQCDVKGWTDIVAVSAGWDHTVGLKSDGRVVAVGDNAWKQCDVDGWKNVKLPDNK